MTVRSFPHPGQESGEDDYARLHVHESGVISGLDLSFNGLGWSLSPGAAMAGGFQMLVESDPATGASEPVSGANPRRDLLVARRTLDPENGSSVVPVLKPGSPAASPADPPLTRDTVGVFEEPLFSWQVPGDGGTVVTGVRDLRRSVTTNAGTSGVIAGAAPPPGTTLKMKTYVGAIPTNSFGDTQVVLPGNAFPNGLVMADVGILGVVPVDAKVREDSTVGVIRMRVYDLGSGAAVGALPALRGYVMAWGW